MLDIPFGFFFAVAVKLHYALDAEFLGRVNEYPHYIRTVSENEVGGAANDDTAAAIGNLLYDLVLGADRMPNNLP